MTIEEVILQGRKWLTIVGARRTGKVLAVAAALFALQANAQQVESTLPGVQPGPAEESTANHVRRPRIGLVLGGGGAKGSAHIGVLSLLEELRIPIDCIAATSMGALVGATYAAGATAAEIEEQVLDINWGYTLGGQGSRDQMPIERKLAGSGYSNTLEVGVRDGRLLGRGGLIETQNVESVIWKLVANAQATGRFDDLPIPFRAIATDVISGKMVVLEEGELPIAMRASMAIPGAFSPVEIDDMVLVDGGLTRNLPVDVARDLCADVVIAVWFTSPSPDKADVASSLSLINRALDVMVTANQNEQVATLTEKDVGIAVPTGDIGTSQFDRSPEAIELGRKTAALQRSALARYSLSEDEYLAWQTNVHQDVDPTYELAEVKFVNTGRVNPDYLNSQLQSTHAGTEVSSSEIVADTERLYALGDFERIEYRMRGPAEARILEIQPIEKSWGPNFLRFDLGLATQDNADLSGLLRVDHERTWVNSLGGRWHNGIQFGRQSVLETDFYQPLDVEQRFFVHPSLHFEESVEDIYIEGDRIAVYKIREFYGQLDVGINVGNRLQMRAGLQHGWNRADLDTGLPELPGQPREKDTNLQLRLIYDTRDSIALPTKGSFLSARYVNSVDWFDSAFNYDMIEGVLSKAYNLRGNSLSVVIGGGRAINGELPITQEIVLGGIQTFPGLRPGELRGEDYWFAGTSYLWRLVDIQPIFDQAIYAGVRLQAAQMNGRFDSENDDPLFGISGSLSGRTPVGAFILSLGYVDDGSLRLQFTVGRPVPEGSLLDAVR